MKAKIIKIGNSRGIRIPKSLLDESSIENEVDIESGDGIIVIKSVSENRKSWDKAFKKMSKNNDDILLDHETLSNQTKWDNEEWEW
jgi:antitoxin MazE